jgi:hypothetical protein
VLMVCAEWNSAGPHNLHKWRPLLALARWGLVRVACAIQPRRDTRGHVVSPRANARHKRMNTGTSMRRWRGRALPAASRHI